MSLGHEKKVEVLSLLFLKICEYVIDGKLLQDNNCITAPHIITQ